MHQRDFPGHIAWSEARMNGDHALAFVAVKSLVPETEVHFHLLYNGRHFPRLVDADRAADAALDMLTHFDRNHEPIFSSPRC